MKFADLDLIDPLLRAIETEGYTSPTPIQEQAVPYVLEGRDVLGCAQTGTGKTAAFALPILQRLVAARTRHRGKIPIRVLVLSPTRELAAQIADSFKAYGRHLPIRCTVVFGGVGQQPQRDALRRGVHVLVATPGRLLDLMQQGYIDFGQLEVFVLDEADRMLDMGFIHDVKRVIAAIPAKRQTLFFSATMPPDIQDLAASILHDPASVAVTPPATTVELVDQRVCFVEKADKRALLEHFLKQGDISRALVFTRTKHGADRVVKHLTRNGLKAIAIHGNKSQGARERALGGFKRGDVPVLVATDIAARGIDVESISHVINFDVPNIAETYVHRIGRTARAGASGFALSFCQEDERPYLVDIQRLIGQHIFVVEDHPLRSHLGTPLPATLRKAKQGRLTDGEARGRARPQQGGGNPERRRRPRRPKKKAADNTATAPRTTDSSRRGKDGPGQGAPRKRNSPADQGAGSRDGAPPRRRRRHRPKSGPSKPTGGA